MLDCGHTCKGILNYLKKNFDQDLRTRKNVNPAWILNVPRMNKIKITGQMEANTVEYATYQK